MRKTIIALNLVILVGLTTAEPCMAQIGRGGLIRRLFGRNIQEEADAEEEAKEKAEKEAKAKADAAKRKKEKAAAAARSEQRGSPTLAPKQTAASQDSTRNAEPPAAAGDGFGLSTKAFPLDRKDSSSPLGLAVIAVERAPPRTKPGLRRAINSSKSQAPRLMRHSRFLALKQFWRRAISLRSS